MFRKKTTTRERESKKQELVNKEKRMLDKIDKIEANCQQLLDRKEKKRFNEAWLVKSITKQGDTLHVTIQLEISPNFYVILWFNVCYRDNMKIAMKKKKAK